MIRALIGGVLWTGVCSSLLGVSYMASSSGFGAQRENPAPVSIREGSVKDPNGIYRTRYFVGGGLRGGK